MADVLAPVEAVSIVEGSQTIPIPAVVTQSFTVTVDDLTLRLSLAYSQLLFLLHPQMINDTSYTFGDFATIRSKATSGATILEPTDTVSRRKLQSHLR